MNDWVGGWMEEEIYGLGGWVGGWEEVPVWVKHCLARRAR